MIISLPIVIYAQSASETKDLKYFLHQLYTIDNLPSLEDSHTSMSSTWDTTGGNSDGDCFKNLQGTKNILLDVDGPGCIHRIFTGVTYGFIDASTFGTKIQVFIDNNASPLYDMDVTKFFDDVMVLASKSLPKKYTDALEPWDLQNLTPFSEKYLSGFKTESYQVDVKTGYEEAKTIMDKTIKQLVTKDIGGDEQKIYSTNTSYSNITFKHILLPIWISAYTFKNKVYRFLVNARTAEVQGERPWSWIKITLFVLMILAIIAGIILLAKSRN